MKVYLVKKDYRFAEITPNAYLLDIIDKGIFGESMKGIWNEAQKMNWNFEEGKIKGDFVFLLGHILVVNGIVKIKILEIENESSIEFLPISVDGDDYYIINILNKYSDILDLKQSEITYFSNKEIMFVEKFVYKTGINLKSIFKISEFLHPNFVTEKLQNIIVSNNLKGVIFEECKYSKKSWFDKLF